MREYIAENLLYQILNILNLTIMSWDKIPDGQMVGGMKGQKEWNNRLCQE